jgi:hypothetical protein
MILAHLIHASITGAISRPPHTYLRSRRAVADCLMRLEIILSDAAALLPYTHFVSVPLNSPKMQHRFEALSY